MDCLSLMKGVGGPPTPMYLTAIYFHTQESGHYLQPDTTLFRSINCQHDPIELGTIPGKKILSWVCHLIRFFSMRPNCFSFRFLLKIRLQLSRTANRFVAFPCNKTWHFEEPIVSPQVKSSSDGETIKGRALKLRKPCLLFVDHSFPLIYIEGLIIYVYSFRRSALSSRWLI